MTGKRTSTQAATATSPSHRVLRSISVPSARLEIRQSRYPAIGSGTLVMPQGLLELSLSGRAASGEVYFHRDHKRRLGGRVGDMAYIPADMRFEGNWQRGIETTFCCFFSGDSAECSQPWEDQDLAAALAIKSPFMESLARQLTYELEHQRPYREVAIEGLCLQLAAEVGRQRRMARHQGTSSSISRAEEFSRIVQAIEAGVVLPSLRGLAGSFGLSERHLGRLFIENTGQTFSRFILNLKMKRARYLLSSTTRAIKDIAFEMGYSVPADFTRAFSKEVGRSPSAYRTETISGRRDMIH